VTVAAFLTGRRRTRAAARDAEAAATALRRAYQETIRVLDHHPVPGGGLATVLYRADGHLREAAQLLRRRWLSPPGVADIAVVVIMLASLGDGPFLPAIAVVTTAAVVGVTHLAATMLDRRRRRPTTPDSSAAPCLKTDIAAIRGYLDDARDRINAALADRPENAHAAARRAVELIRIASVLCATADRHLAEADPFDPPGGSW
jgi:hypothetical protein